MTVSPLHILLADDNPAARSQIAGLLAQLGHETTVVEDGAQAVSALAAIRFDLAILDLDMPAPAGPEIAVGQGPDGVPMMGLSPADGARSALGAGTHSCLAGETCGNRRPGGSDRDRAWRGSARRVCCRSETPGDIHGGRSDPGEGTGPAVPRLHRPVSGPDACGDRWPGLEGCRPRVEGCRTGDWRQ